MALVWILWLGATLFIYVKIAQAFSWHRHKGARVAKAEFGRLLREQPQSADAQLSEGEFVEKFVSARVGTWVWVLAGLAMAVVGLPLLVTLSMR
jgi:hypothetical protein